MGESAPADRLEDLYAGELLAFVRAVLDASFVAPLMHERVPENPTVRWVFHSFLQELGYLYVLGSEERALLATIQELGNTPALESWEALDPAQPDAAREIAANLLEIDAEQRGASTWQLIPHDPTTRLRFVFFASGLVVPVASHATALDDGREQIDYLVGRPDAAAFLKARGISDERQLRLESAREPVEFEDALLSLPGSVPDRPLHNWRVSRR